MGSPVKSLTNTVFFAIDRTLTAPNAPWHNDRMGHEDGGRPEPGASGFNPKEKLLELIQSKGGWVNAHAHLDRAYTLTAESFCLSGAPLEQKWDALDDYKRHASVDDIYDRMAYAVEVMCRQGVRALGTFIDVDPV